MEEGMRMRRSWMSWAQRNELWRRWRAGESFTDIARALQRDHARIYQIVDAEGGIAPPPRRRSRWALTAAERETLSRGVAAGLTIRAMARQLGRAPSTVSRELSRHGGRARYRARRADRRAWARARRPQRCRLATRPRLRDLVARKLAQQWSPQQISYWLRQTFPSDPERQVSHETIYRTLFVQS